MLRFCAISLLPRLMFRSNRATKKVATMLAVGCNSTMRRADAEEFTHIMGEYAARSCAANGDSHYTRGMTSLRMYSIIAGR